MLTRLEVKGEGLDEVEQWLACPKNSLHDASDEVCRGYHQGNVRFAPSVYINNIRPRELDHFITCSFAFTSIIAIGTLDFKIRNSTSVETTNIIINVLKMPPYHRTYAPTCKL